jgi:hypothetical protein
VRGRARRTVAARRPPLRLRALSALIDVHGLGERALVHDALADADVRVRIVALMGVERFGRVRDLLPVLPLLGDGHPRVRAIARETIARVRARSRRRSPPRARGARVRFVDDR